MCLQLGFVMVYNTIFGRFEVDNYPSVQTYFDISLKFQTGLEV